MVTKGERWGREEYISNLGVTYIYVIYVCFIYIYVIYMCLVFLYIYMLYTYIIDRQQGPTP